jgi:hypothetical protein
MDRAAGRQGVWQIDHVAVAFLALVRELQSPRAPSRLPASSKATRRSALLKKDLDVQILFQQIGHVAVAFLALVRELQSPRAPSRLRSTCKALSEACDLQPNHAGRDGHQ